MGFGKGSRDFLLVQSVVLVVFIEIFSSFLRMENLALMVMVILKTQNIFERPPDIRPILETQNPMIIYLIED